MNGEPRNDNPLRVSEGIQAQKSLLSRESEIVVFDVGAHVGATAAEYMSAFPSARIFAFEPDPDSYAEFQSYFAGISRVVPSRKALGDRVGEADLHRNEYAPTHSLLARPQAGFRYYPSNAGPVGTASVPISTVDAEMQAAGLRRLSVLKMDVQGAELLAMQGAKAALSAGAVAVLYLEVAFVSLYEDGAEFPEILEYLKGYGYSLFSLYDLRHAKNGQLIAADALILSPEIRECLESRES